MSSIVEKLVSRTRLPWYGFVVALGLVSLLSAIAAYLGGVPDEVSVEVYWRGLLVYPALTLYILSIIPIVRYVGDHALAALRTLVPADDESFDCLVEETTHSSARGEWIAFGSGVAFGLLVGLYELLTNEGTPGVRVSFSWAGVHVLLTGSLTFGLLFWSVHAALSSGRLMAALHRQPLKVDIFDQGAFEPVGRQSLVNALAFFGGALLSLLFVVRDLESLMKNLVVYGILVLVSVIVFFLPMRQTHRVLASAKHEELARVQHNIVSAYRALEEFPADSPNLGILPTRLSLWKEYEVRVKATRTWPFNLGMVRTFALSVLTPIAISLVQRLLSQLFNF